MGVYINLKLSCLWEPIFGGCPEVDDWLYQGSSIKLVNVPQCAKFVKISFYFLCFCEALMCHMWHMHRHLRNPALNFRSIFEHLLKKKQENDLFN